jgi:phosphoglucosamine mutase
VARLFGTDGVRGTVGDSITVDLAVRLGAAGADVLAGAPREGRRPIAIVGRDPRPSGTALEAAVAAGLAAQGLDVLLTGIVPTPAVALLTARLGADLGVMLSASHNPMPDNGIKFFGAGGRKLTDAQEAAIEALVTEGEPSPAAGGAAIGRIGPLDDAVTMYADHVLATSDQSLDGLRIIIDCANGSAGVVAADVLRRAGAEVVVLHDELDGVAINDGCGSTHPEALQAAVAGSDADLGLAFDGDADRCLAVDAGGRLVDGDQIMGLLAVAAHARGQLHRATLVVTVMSNAGLHRAMASAGIDVVTTGVGDRAVLEALDAEAYSLGGEQSGHIVMADHATTGDGLLTGLHVAAEVAASGRPLSELAAVVAPMPQVLVNVGGVDRAGLAESRAVAEAIADAEAELSGAGRVLLRPSGTEPLVRVMVEAESAEQARSIADRLADAVRADLGMRMAP